VIHMHRIAPPPVPQEERVKTVISPRIAGRPTQT
jgi:hypothetical protein